MLGPLTLWRSLAAALLKRRQETASPSLSRDARRGSRFLAPPVSQVGHQENNAGFRLGGQSFDYLSDASYSFKLGQARDKNPATIPS
jgi:hypothetical protein